MDISETLSWTWQQCPDLVLCFSLPNVSHVYGRRKSLLTLSQYLILADRSSCLEFLHKNFYWSLSNKIDDQKELLRKGCMFSMTSMTLGDRQKR
jgi:hypothetical protein